MLLPWLLVTIISLLSFFYKFNNGKISSNRRAENIFLILKGAYYFLVKVKSEDRLTALKQIHKFFPRYTRIKFFSFDTIIVYDPELCKKIFSAHSACQRPFRNCMQFHYGLLSSECEFIGTTRSEVCELKHVIRRFTLVLSVQMNCYYRKLLFNLQFFIIFRYHEILFNNRLEYYQVLIFF